MMHVTVVFVSKQLWGGKEGGLTRQRRVPPQAQAPTVRVEAARPARCRVCAQEYMCALNAQRCAAWHHAMCAGQPPPRRRVDRPGCGDKLKFPERVGVDTLCIAHVHESRPGARRVGDNTRYPHT